MMLERQHLPFNRSLLDSLHRNGIVAEIIALFHAISHHPPKPEADTSIAWEDGEIEDADPRDASL